jgi:hypothetical protein
MIAAFERPKAPFVAVRPGFNPVIIPVIGDTPDPNAEPLVIAPPVMAEVADVGHV